MRVPILDKTKEGNFLLINGKVENGTVTLNDKLITVPSNAPAQVLEIKDSQDELVKCAYPGEIVQIKVNVADEEVIQKGYVLCHKDQPMPVSQLFEADLEILDIPAHAPITKGFSCMMHLHTIAEEVEIKTLIKADDKLNPKLATKNQKLLCRISTRNPLAMEKFEVMPSMAWFTLRYEG